MTPYSALAAKSPHGRSDAAGRETNLSLMISIGALRLVNTVERSLNTLRRHKAR